MFSVKATDKSLMLKEDPVTARLVEAADKAYVNGQTATGEVRVSLVERS